MFEHARRVSLLVMLLLLSAPWAVVSWPQERAAAARVFICPMHPDVIGTEADTCPRCGMRLVPSQTTDPRPSVLALEIAPKAVRPHQRAVVRVRLSGPDGARITRLETLHEKPMHVFLVSHSLDYFAHLHPEAVADGAFEVPVSLPHDGVYHAFVEFMPLGGTPQMLQRAFATADWTGGVARTQLAEDVAPKVDRALKMQIQLPADGLAAGRAANFRCSISDAATGAPINDLQPYLGTLAHLFAVSADLTDATHVHPIPDFSDPAGPNLVFEGMFPRPGRYRLWLQVQRGGELYVTPFTISVGPD